MTDTETTTIDLLAHIREAKNIIEEAEITREEAERNALPRRPLAYIRAFYYRFDMIPSETCLADHLHGYGVRNSKKKAKAALKRLEFNGILTEVGRFSGRRHLTQKGYEYYAT